MRKIRLSFLIILLTILISQKIHAQTAGNWLWAKVITENNLQGVRATAIDPQGNVLVCGGYSSPTLTLGDSTFTNAGGADFYVAKYDPNGNILWARSSGGIDNDRLNAIATDAAGNVFVTGGSNSAVLTIGDTTIYLGGMILIKYNSAGDIVRVKVGRGGSVYDGTAIAVDHQDNVFVTGTFYPSAMGFDTVEVHPTSVIAGNDTYLVKFNNDCNAIWGRSSTAEYPGGLAADKAGNIYLTISSRFAPNTFGSITPPNPDYNYSNIYLVKYSTNGDVIWAKTALGNKDDYAYGIDTDDSCNVYFTGNFNSDSLKFDNLKLIGTGYSMYVAKFDSSGNAIWARSGTNAAVGTLATDVSGNVYVGGTLSAANFTIGSTYLVNHSSTSADALIMKFKSNGDLGWAQLLGGTLPDNLAGLLPDLNGDLINTGNFSSTSINFGNIVLNNPNTGAHGWMAKLHPAADPVIICPPVANTIITINAIAASYQWQVDMGTGYSDINDNANYTGTATLALELINTPSSWYGYKYRCVFDGHNSSEYMLKFFDTWTGAVSNVWEDPLNWSCGAVPDEYTDVVINTGSVQINSDVTVRTITVSAGATVNVSSGYTLTVLH